MASGAFAGSRLAAGRGRRTGHGWVSGMSRPETRAIVARDSTSPGPDSHSTWPDTPAGTSARNSIAALSGTVPRTVPAATVSPTCTAGVNRHCALGLANTPALRRSPTPLSRRSIPSKTLPINPGPSCATSGSPVARAGSPGRRPPVYSYTWTVATPSMIPITSPGSPSWPTSTSSCIAAARPSTSTTGPFTRRTVPALTATEPPPEPRAIGGNDP